MSTYVVGDIQGCMEELQQLLAHIHFDAAHDVLWVTGDLVNRGPASLAVLRFLKQLGSQHKIVLGNHDLHLIAAHYGYGRVHASDTFQDVLAASDRAELIDWLRHRPLLHHDKTSGFVMAHAGLAPAWTLHQAKMLAQEVEVVLQSAQPERLLQQMYGNLPDRWSESLAGVERWRCIINFLTRMRFCYADGRLDLGYKGEIAGKPADLIPWFDVPGRANASEKITFGHWAALNGQADAPNIFPLDTGCVWGNALSALCLETGERFSIKCG